MTPQTATGSGNFTVDTTPVTLGPEESQLVDVSLTPDAVGGITGQFTLDANRSSASEDITLKATGQSPELSVAEPVAFGRVATGSSSSTQVSLENTGNATLRVDTAAAFNASESSFSLVGAPETLSIDGGETATLTVAFSPTAAVDVTETLTLGTNVPASKTTNVTLTGEGVTTDLEVNRSLVGFGAVGVNETATETLEIRNDAQGNLTIDRVAVTQSSAAFTAGTVSTTDLSDGGTATVPLTFDPSGTTLGAQSATVVIDATDENGQPTQLTVTVNGTAVGPEAAFDSTTTPVRGGFVRTNNRSTTTVTIRNDAIEGTTLKVTNLEISGANESSFSTGGLTTPLAIEGASSRDIPVEFHPTSDGAKNATLTLTTNDADTPTLNVTLLGTGAAPVPEVDEQSVDFGEVNSEATETRTVTVSNTGGVRLRIQNATVTGADAYTVTSATSATVVPGGTAEIQVQVQPEQTGSLTGTLTVKTNATTDPTVSLSTDGIAPSLAVTADGTKKSNQSTVGYSDTPIGSSTSKTIQLKNTGDGPLVFSQARLSDTDAFSIVSGLDTTRIAPGSSKTITVAYSPQVTGDDTTTFRLEGLNEVDRDTFTVTLSGRGVYANTTLDPAAVDFGTVKTGSSQPKTLTL
ncbi:MAG: beta strand repeat-containing protein, partial [Halobaculum sp.]